MSLAFPEQLTDICMHASTYKRMQYQILLFLHETRPITGNDASLV